MRTPNMPQSLAAIYVHVVFSTKNRQPLISDDMAKRLHPYLGGIVRTHGGIALEIGGMPDHVHLLVSLGRTLSISELVRVVKANATNWIRETFRAATDFAWQAGYGAFSVSASNLEALTQYTYEIKPNIIERYRFRTNFENFTAGTS